MTRAAAKRLWTAGWPLLCLCLLSGSCWLLESAHPKAHSTALTEAVGCWMAGGWVFLVQKTQRRSASRLRRSSLGQAGWRGVLPVCLGEAFVVAGSAIAVSMTRQSVSANNVTLAMVLTPCVIAVTVPAMGGGPEENISLRLWPGLAGVAGLLLLLPQPILSDWRLVIALMAMPVFAGVGASVAVQRLEVERSVGRMSAVRDGMVLSLPLAGSLYGVLALRHLGEGNGPFFWFLAALDGLLATLTLVALRRLGPMRWAAQFCLTPLITIIEGVFFLRPPLNGRLWLALALLAVSGVYLLFASERATRQMPLAGL